MQDPSPRSEGRALRMCCLKTSHNMCGRAIKPVRLTSGTNEPLMISLPIRLIATGPDGPSPQGRLEGVQATLPLGEMSLETVSHGRAYSLSALGASPTRRGKHGEAASK